MIPIVLQYPPNSSVENLGGTAVYPNQLRRVFSESKKLQELDSRIRLGDALLRESCVLLYELIFRVSISIARKLCRTKLSLLGEFFFKILARKFINAVNNDDVNLPIMIYHQMTNFVFPPYSLLKLSKKYRIYMITTWVDFLDLEFPTFVTKSERIERLYLRHFLSECSKKHISLTQFVRDDLFRFGILTPGQDVNIIPYGTNHIESSLNICRSSCALRVPEHYFLFPAKSWLHKGHLGFLKAYLKSDATFKVVFIGDFNSVLKEMNYEIEHSSKRNSTNILLFGFVNEEIKQHLMFHAQGIILPSFYEGFGFPYFEAARLSRAIFGFRTKAFQEFFNFGVNNNMVEVGDFDGLVKVIEAFDQHQNDANIANSFRISQELTWEKCALLTEKIYGAE